MNALQEIQQILPSIADADIDDTTENLWKRITVLSDRAWEGRVNKQVVDNWLDNFNGASGTPVETERLHALFILSQFLYFGSVEIRVLLRALFRDLFLIPLVQEVRRTHGNTRDLNVIRPKVREAIERSRFLGVGNPSESGVHLLYFFRQENRLSKHQFMDTAQIVEKVTKHGKKKRALRHPAIERYIFLDDVCGSGETAVRYSNDFLDDIRKINPAIKLYYHSLFATAGGMNRVRTKSLFKRNCGAVFEFDESYKCLASQSRYLKVVPKHIDPKIVRKVAKFYGELLWPGHGRGYENSQMLLGFHHNTPDNTLPIIWMDLENAAAIPWTPAFQRYPKE